MLSEYLKFHKKDQTEFRKMKEFGYGTLFIIFFGEPLLVIGLMYVYLPRLDIRANLFFFLSGSPSFIDLEHQMLKRPFDLL
jgi:hypothetical protein